MSKKRRIKELEGRVKKLEALVEILNSAYDFLLDSDVAIEKKIKRLKRRVKELQ